MVWYPTGFVGTADLPTREHQWLHTTHIEDTRGSAALVLRGEHGDVHG